MHFYPKSLWRATTFQSSAILKHYELSIRDTIKSALLFNLFESIISWLHDNLDPSFKNARDRTDVPNEQYLNIRYICLHTKPGSGVTLKCFPPLTAYSFRTDVQSLFSILRFILAATNNLFVYHIVYLSP